MHIIGFLLILILLIVLVPILLVVVWGMNQYFKMKQKIFEGRTSGNTNTYSSSNTSSSQQTTSTPPQQGKIIPKDEGEYVSYEVVE